MNVLVTGANGFVGLPLCRLLRQSGMRVCGAVRRPIEAPDFEPIVIGEIGADTQWRAALEGIDVVVHLAARVHVMRDTAPDPLAAFSAVNLHGTTHLARQARAAGVKRFVFVSSAKVQGESTAERPYTEDQPPQPEGPYAASKWAAEQALPGIAGPDMQLTILRPPLVYGPHVRGNFLALLKAVYRRWPLPVGAIENRRSLLGVDNLAHAIACCVSHPAAAGRTFLVSDREDLSTPDLVRSLATALEVQPRLIAIPRAVLLLAGTLSGRRAAVERLTGSLQLDSSRIARELGWSPPYSVAAGLAATARWYRQAVGGAAV
jgi:UDP-N-acetyl-alpha-D-quinovosamine dehydrogenase